MSNPKPADPGGDVQLQIRMPLRLHDRLRRKAIKERRSMSSQARALIAEGLKRSPAADAAAELSRQVWAKANDKKATQA